MTDLDVLRRLPRLALREGYVDAYQVFGWLHTRFASLRRLLDGLPLPLRSLVMLFLLSEIVAEDQLSSLFSGFDLEALVRLGVLVQVTGGLRANKLLLFPVLGRLAFVPSEVPPGWLGGEPMALMVRVPAAVPRQGTAIDLCAGSGVPALHLASGGARVVAVEPDARLAQLARLNVAMAELEERIEVREGDLWLAAPGERFDRVIAAPPSVPMPPPLAAAGPHGGRDGFSVARRILGALPRILAHGGTAHLAAVCLGDAAGPHATADLERIARDNDLSLVLTLPARLSIEPGGNGFERLLGAFARAAGIDGEVARSRLVEHLAEQQADHLYLAFLTASRGRAGLQATSHYRESGGFWFR